DDVPLSPFCMANVGEWDKFRNVDMDKEGRGGGDYGFEAVDYSSTVTMIKALEGSSSKRKNPVDADKVAVLTAWHRVGCRTREAFRRSFLPELINGYEECIRAFVEESGDGDVLVLQVQDPFHRLLLHGVCEVDAFTDSPFKGNPVAVCLLEEDRDEEWLQAVAREFNISETCYLTRITDSESESESHDLPNGTITTPRFRFRWFTPVAE
ncbi:unnamed protein product, partial [Ilex paraguariensis]